ncbi:MAG: hypothetical protein HGB04_03910 [Chlorobiaceae bacterium]|nr:hypothetical protein [Chlorobiaceae bacterium]
MPGDTVTVSGWDDEYLVLSIYTDKSGHVRANLIMIKVPGGWGGIDIDRLTKVNKGEL